MNMNFNQNQMNPMMMNQMMMNNMNPMMMNQMNMNPMMMNQMNMNPMMLMMFQNMNNYNNNNNNQQLWNLYFQTKKGTEQAVMIVVSPEATVKEAINLYRIKTNQLNDAINFIFNGKQLDFNLKLSQSGLANASTITVIGLKDVEGA